jgi:hypothetical protein
MSSANGDRDTEDAIELVAARLREDVETMIAITERNPTVGGGVVALACSLTLMAAATHGVTVDVFLDEMLLAAARQRLRGEQ